MNESDITLWQSRALMALAALIFNVLIFRPALLPESVRAWLPGQGIMEALKRIEHKLNRQQRSAQERRRRGTFITVISLAVTCVLGLAAHMAISSFHYGMVIELLCVAALISVRQDIDNAMELKNILERDDLVQARSALWRTGAWRNASLLDAGGLARAGIETLCIRMAETFLHPLMWYMVWGLPGMMTARMAVSLASTMGQEGEAFGRTAKQTARILTAIPCALCALLMAAASACLPFARPGSALRHSLSLRPRRMVLGAAGGALRIALGGPLSIFAPGAWIATGLPQAGARDIGRSLWLAWSVVLLVALLLGVMVV